jgi:hypothetical protein
MVNFCVDGFIPNSVGCPVVKSFTKASIEINLYFETVSEICRRHKTYLLAASRSLNRAPNIHLGRGLHRVKLRLDRDAVPLILFFS